MPAFIKNKNLGQVSIYLAFFIAVFFIGLHQLKNVNKLAADDLILRINGSALQHNQKEIYFYKWQKGDAEKYFYYSQRPTQLINGITATPLLLWTHSALISLSYCDIKLVWLVIELLFLFASVLLLLQSTAKFEKKIVILFGFILFFACSPNWFVHIESGQVYIIFAFTFSLYYWLDKKDFIHKKYYQSILISLTIFFRPILIISVLYFLFKRDFEIIKKGIVSFLIIGTLTLFLYPISNWVSYQKAMQEYSKEVVDKISVPNNIIPNQVPDKPIECLNNPTQRMYNAGALYTVQKYLHNLKIDVSNVFVFLVCYFIGILLLLLTLKNNWKKLNIKQHFVLLFLFYLLFELCTPTVRNPYNLIQWLAPALLILSSWRLHFSASIAMLLGLLLNQHVFFEFKYSREIGEILMIISAWLFILCKPKSILLNKFIFFPKSN